MTTALLTMLLFMLAKRLGRPIARVLPLLQFLQLRIDVFEPGSNDKRDLRKRVFIFPL
jgi:hypothetical protein